MEVVKDEQGSNLSAVGTSRGLSKASLWHTLFGSILTKEFWIDLMQLAIREMVTAAFAAAGGALIHFAAKRSMSSSSAAVQGMAAGRVGAPPTPAANPNNAFAGGYQPKPSYQPFTPPAGQGTIFPGFG